jgi:hypothetical protein
MTDVFKKVYTTLRPESSALILEAKTKAEELLLIMDKAVDGILMNNAGKRELALAKTNLEQAMMWYTKSVVIADDCVRALLSNEKGAETNG